jgi:hypothetical protein
MRILALHIGCLSPACETRELVSGSLNLTLGIMISDFHDGEYEDGCLLGCSAVQSHVSDTNIVTAQFSILYEPTYNAK